VRFSLRDPKKRELHQWTIDIGQPRINPHDWAAFETKLENPPAGAASLEIRTLDPEEP
jgi:hypothetical protein